MYVTLDQLAERPGARELAQVASTEHADIVDAELMEASLRGADRNAWSVEEIAAADTALARISEAVDQADGLIDGFLRKRGYTVPMTPVHRVVVQWSRAIARYYLHKDNIADANTSPVARDYRDALKLLQQLAEGKFSLGVDDPLAPATERDVRFYSADRQFNTDTLKDY